MASILSNSNPQNTINNPIDSVKNVINQIMSSANPQATFQQVLQQSPDAAKAMQMINQYGNGNPQQAFLNYANQTGKQELAKQILQKLGLN